MNRLGPLSLLLALALVGCGPTDRGAVPTNTGAPSYTGVVMNISDIADEPAIEWSQGWVLVVPDSDSARLWEVLSRDPSEPESTAWIGSPANSVSGWSELGTVALVGFGGRFDAAIEPGVYWICYGFEVDWVNGLRLDGCGHGDVVPGEIEINLSMGGVFLGQR